MSIAEIYSDVFAPEVFVLVATLLLIGYEARTENQTRASLVARTGAAVGAWTLAFAVYRGGPTLVAGSVPGGEDLYASIGLIVGFAVIWLVWQRRNAGPFVPEFCLLLIGTSVIHAVVVPVWDVSSHVLYAVVPTVYLSAVDRRFAVLLVIPVGMLWSRVAVGAHTIVESIAGLGLGVMVITGARIIDKRKNARDGPISSDARGD